MAYEIIDGYSVNKQAFTQAKISTKNNIIIIDANVEKVVLGIDDLIEHLYNLGFTRAERRNVNSPYGGTTLYSEDATRNALFPE